VKPALRPPEPPRTSADIAEKRVLIVDDSKFVRTTFNRILSASFAVTECADGEAGWRAIQSDPGIVMVVSDLDMPKLDGYELLAHVRASPDARIRALPVIIISGNQNAAGKKRALEMGANDFIAKEADAPEVLLRIANVLRLVQTGDELEQSKRTLEQTASLDPLTGALSPRYLLMEARKHYAHARRHGGQMSAMAFQLDSYSDVVRSAGKDVADQLLARIAKLVRGTLRTEDSIGRVAETLFVVISTGPGASQVLSFARRLYEQLQNARVAYGATPLKIVASFGTASPRDMGNSADELIKLALQRLQAARVSKGERIVGGDAVPAARANLPKDIEHAVSLLAQASAQNLGDASDEVLLRLLPFLHGALRRVKIELPVEKIAAMLNRPPASGR
jgi:two-component system, cell cycle response regulator